MKHILPTNPELLVELAAQAGLDYQDAYNVWVQVYEQPDAYATVATVLYVARMHRLPVCMAHIAYDAQLSRPTNYELTPWITA